MHLWCYRALVTTTEIDVVGMKASWEDRIYIIHKQCEVEPYQYINQDGLQCHSTQDASRCPSTNSPEALTTSPLLSR
ncbi:hypothetical protein LguiB_032930 [Lonicera macranthoides]